MTDNDQTDFCEAFYSTYLFVDPYKQHVRQNAAYVYAALGSISLIIVLFLLYWVNRRNRFLIKGRIDEANKMHLYIYRYLIKIYTGAIVIQCIICIINVFVSTTDAHLLHEKSWNWYYVAVGGIASVLPSGQMALVSFIYTKNTISRKALKQGYMFAIPFSIVWFIGYCLVLVELYWIRIIIDICFLCLCVYIIFRQILADWTRSNIVIRYICCVIFINLFDLIYFLLEIKKKDALCIAEFGFYIWTGVYPIVFFITIKKDSEFWWSDAAQVISSTRQPVHTFELFELIPTTLCCGSKNGDENDNGGGGSVDIRTGDNKYHFRKFKQMLSANVPSIKFDEIDFNTGSNNSGGDGKDGKDDSKQKQQQKQKQNQVGSGATGVVIRGTYKHNQVAIKKLIKLDDKTKNKYDDNHLFWRELTLIFRESLLVSSLYHTNIVKFYGVSTDDKTDEFYMIYEYCEFGDLKNILIEKKYGNNEKLRCIKQRLWYLIDICNAMLFLHNNSFVHRDLKLDNIVVTWDEKADRYVGKICDFGASRKLRPKQRDTMDRNQSIWSMRGSSVSKYDSKHRDSKKESLLLHNNNDSEETESLHTLEYIPDYKQTEVELEDETNEIELVEIQRTINVGTPAFLAPEILFKWAKLKGAGSVLRKYSVIDGKGKGKNAKTLGTTDDDEEDEDDPLIYCDFATDVYAYGMLMWSIITCKIPYIDVKPSVMIKMVYNHQRLDVSQQQWKEWEEKGNVDRYLLSKLLDMCWAQYAHQRPTFNQINSHLCGILKNCECDNNENVWPCSKDGALLVAFENKK